MLLRSLVVSVLLAPALLAAGCSSSGTDGSTSTSAGSSIHSGPIVALADKVGKGVAGLKSAHLDVDAGPLAGTISGEVTFADGKTTASDLTINQGSGPVEVIMVDGTSYAKLPGSQNTTDKPWLQVSASSSNEFIRGLAGTLSLTGAATSLGSLTGLLETATTAVKDSGSEQVNGVTAEHYALTIDPTKVTGDLGTALTLAGTKPLPVDLWIDPQGRPVQIKIAIPFGQQSVPLLVKVSKFDAPVSISAPPSSQVGS